MKRKERKQASWLMRLQLIAVAGLLSGCSTLFHVDLDEQRQENLAKDLDDLTIPLERRLEGPLTLDLAIQIAIDNNLQIRLTEFEEKIRREESFAEQLRMLPAVEVRKRSWETSELRVVNSLNIDTGNVQLQNDVSEFKRRRTASIEATWNILDFGLSFVRSRKAGLEHQAATMRRLRQKQQIALDVTSAYWRAVLAEKSLGDMDRVMRSMKLHKAAIDEAIRQKRLNAIEGQDIALRLVELAIEMQNARERIATAHFELADLMSIRPAGDTFELVQISAADVLKGLPQVHELDVGQMEQYALLNRPELFERDLQTEVRVSDVHEAILSSMPSVRFEYSRFWDHNPLLTFNYWNQVAANVSWNLMGLLPGYFQYRSAKWQVKNADAERLAMTMSVITQLHVSMLNYDMQRERMTLYQQQEDISSTTLRMARDSYQVGTITQIELARRLLEDLVAKLERDNVLVDLIVAHKRLLSTLALPPELWGQGAYQAFETEQFLLQASHDETNKANG